MMSPMRFLILITLCVSVGTFNPIGAQRQAEVDPGVFVTIPSTTPASSIKSSHLTGLQIAIDLTHNVAGRQSLVTTAYTTAQGDLTAHGANLTFVGVGPLTLPLLSGFNAWWIEEDWSSTFSAAEKAALVAYVNNGGCLFFNGDEHGIFTADHGGVISLFNIPYNHTGGFSGITGDITPHFLTNPFLPSGFPGPVASVSVPGATNTVGPIPPAFSVVRVPPPAAPFGRGMVAVRTLGAGGVVVFSEELTIDGVILGQNNRALASRVFEFCAFGLVRQVIIDIKFCSNPNGFNCSAKGKTPVTIFGEATLNVNDINTSSLRLCLASNTNICTGPPQSSSMADRGDPTTDPGAASCAIVAGVEQNYLTQDGLLDLDVAFDTAEVAGLFGCSNLLKGSASPALVLKGQLLSGQPLQSKPVNNVGIDQLLIQNK